MEILAQQPDAYLSGIAEKFGGVAIRAIGESAFHASGMSGALVLDVQRIGDQAFWGCSNLTDVHITGRIEQSRKRRFSGVRKSLHDLSGIHKRESV